MTTPLLPKAKDPRHSGFALAAARSSIRPSERPEQLAALERLVMIGPSGAHQFHTRLRPVLRSIAVHRLRSHHGIDLDGQPEAAAQVLGAELFEVVRSDRPAPKDRRAPGPPSDAIGRLVERLEQL